MLQLTVRQMHQMMSMTMGPKEVVRVQLCSLAVLAKI